MTDNALRELYQEVILDHSRHPRHYGALDGASHKAEGYNPLCGDRVTVYLKLGEDNRVADIKFQGKGCAISQASASLMTMKLKGKSHEAAMSLLRAFQALVTGDDTEPPPELGDLRLLRGVRKFPQRVKCAMLAARAAEQALQQSAGETIVSTEVES